ncbi:MAG: hypothetical protein JSV16_00075 [Candidatus Hydrogenedentota bacterium]|nr:MAG: hypothetical protein JSV16_00075 [Candidatus Hydrogenedentota bacterium]
MNFIEGGYANVVVFEYGSGRQGNLILPGRSHHIAQRGVKVIPRLSSDSDRMEQLHPLCEQGRRFPILRTMLIAHGFSMVYDGREYGVNVNLFTTNTPQ